MSAISITKLLPVGEQDHWLFDQPLSGSFDLVPIDIPDIPVIESDDFDGLANFVPTEVKIEACISSPSTSILKVEENFLPTGLERVGVDSKDESKFDSSNLHDCLETEKATVDFNLMEGLTEFIPWTGFDYTSDGDFDEDEVEDITDKGGGIKKKRKRTNQKQPSADADLIASATEENLRKLGIDPMSNEGKKQRRKIRNRLSAQLHRERKKGYISYLEDLVKERDARLAFASIRIRRLYCENSSLLSKLGLKRSKVGEGDVDYSSTTSAAGHTDSDTGEDSDTASMNSETYIPSISVTNLPKRIMSIGTRFKGSKLGSTISLFSAVLMISINIFGLHIQMINPLPKNSSLNNVDNTSQLMSSTEGDESNTLLASGPDSIISGNSNKQLTAPQHGRSLLSVSSALLSQNLNDFIAQPQGPSNQQYLSDATKYLVPVSLPATNRYVSEDIDNNPKGFSAISISGTQGLWHYRDHVTDLYPPLVRYYYPEEEVTTNYTVNMRVRRNLRTRDDRNDTLSVRSPASDLEEKERHRQRRIKASVTKTTSNNIWAKEDDQIKKVVEGEDGLNMGKTLVPVSSSVLIGQAQSPEMSSSRSQPSLDYTTTTPSSGSYNSMSRILMTQGRALLDPSLVDSPATTRKGNVVPSGEKDERVGSMLMKSLSTWTSTVGRSNIEPPLIRVGVNSMGASQDPSSNMLVMLLPASSVRWGKNWGESSEGTMEAMLKGLNFTDSTYNAYGNNVKSDGATNENEEGMWVEIGCSVFRAQLVRNVTLNS